MCSGALLWLCVAAADRCGDVEAEANLGEIWSANSVPPLPSASTSPDLSAVADHYLSGSTTSSAVLMSVIHYMQQCHLVSPALRGVTKLSLPTV